LRIVQLALEDRAAAREIAKPAKKPAAIVA